MRGDAARRLDLGVPATCASWHPDGKALVVREMTDAGAALVVLTLADGSESEPIVVSDPNTPEYAVNRGETDLMVPLYSPDGSMIAHTTGMALGDRKPGGNGGLDQRNHIMDADGTNDRLVQYSADSDYNDGPSQPGADPRGGITHIWAPGGSVILTLRDDDRIAALVDPMTGVATRQPSLLGPMDWQPVAR